MERIGVFVCHCGTNIAGTVDVAKVAEELGKIPEVVFSTHYTYMCSSAGQQMIEDHIKNDKSTNGKRFDLSGRRLTDSRQHRGIVIEQYTIMIDEILHIH